jgi:N-acylneuraminate cytidylyltransferase
MNIVALIPARAGSKRIPGKNTKLLGGKPLIQWTLEAARESRVFSEIVVCTDDDAALDVGRSQHAICLRRSAVPDTQQDIRWVGDALTIFDATDIFSILRPTSPFRTGDTIRRCLATLQTSRCSSLRAVEKVRQHPCKMWQIDGMLMHPLIDNYWTFPHGVKMAHHGAPFHSQPTQSLPDVYAQNSSIEMAYAWCVRTFGTISGPRVGPFITEGWEGFSIDYPEDWERAEAHAASLV